jgi:hypothetical protein
MGKNTLHTVGLEARGAIGVAGEGLALMHSGHREPSRRLARNRQRRYIQRQIAAVLGGFRFPVVPQRCPGKMVEVPNLLYCLG